jgi:hypothetical protein
MIELLTSKIFKTFSISLISFVMGFGAAWALKDTIDDNKYQRLINEQLTQSLVNQKQMLANQKAQENNKLERKDLIINQLSTSDKIEDARLASCQVKVNKLGVENAKLIKQSNEHKNDIDSTNVVNDLLLRAIFPYATTSGLDSTGMSAIPRDTAAVSGKIRYYCASDFADALREHLYQCAVKLTECSEGMANQEAQKINFNNTVRAINKQRSKE